jgi:peptide/nickel transport system permease protein
VTTIHTVPSVPPVEKRVFLGPALRRNLKSPVGFIAAIGLPIMFVLVVFGSTLSPHPTEDPVGLPHLSPSGHFLFGTDSAGLDIFSRTLTAARLDIGVGLLAGFAAAILGTLIGLLLGLRDGVVANVVLRVVDTLQSLPALLISFTVVALSNGSIKVLILMLALLHAPIFVRATWTSARAARQQEFVHAARRAGESKTRVALVHIGLNSIDASAAQLSVSVGWSILSIAGISFLGGGVHPPTPEWGAMISAGSSGLVSGHWWESILPGAVMALCILWFATVSELVRRSTTGTR